MSVDNLYKKYGIRFLISWIVFGIVLIGYLILVYLLVS